jgi:hypothetical protein
LTNKDIYKAALHLTHYEKNEGRRRRKKKRGKKKHNRDVTMKNDAGMVVANESDKMLLEVGGENKSTITSVKVTSDPGVTTDECVPKEAMNAGIMESNSEDGQKDEKDSSTGNSVAAPGMKRKYDNLLIELERVAVGLQQSKVRRRESPRSLKVGKDKKNEMSKKKRVYNLTAISTAASSSRKSVGGEWKVSTVAETTPEVSLSNYDCKFNVNV